MRNLLWILGVAGVLWIGAMARAAVVSPLTTAFRATGATPRGFSLNGWVQLSSGQQSGSLRVLLEKVANQAHISGPIHLSTQSNYRKASLSRRIAGFYSKVIVERLANGSTFLVIDRVGSQGFRGLKESQMAIRTVLAGYGRLHLAVTLQGVVPSRSMSPSGRNRLIQKALQAVGATPVNGITTRLYSATAGDTALIGSHDSLSGHPVNIQVAVSQNTALQGEQVDVGSPLVTVTY